MEAYVEWYDHEGRITQTACLTLNPHVSMRGAHSVLVSVGKRYGIYLHEWFELEDFI